MLKKLRDTQEAEQNKIQELKTESLKLLDSSRQDLSSSLSQEKLKVAVQAKALASTLVARLT